MKRKISLLVIFNFFILLIAGYLAVTDKAYSSIAMSVAGCFIGAIIVLATKKIIFKRKISEYDVSAITVITILFSLVTATSGLFLSNSTLPINVLITSAILLIGGLIALKIFHHSNRNTPSRSE